MKILLVAPSIVPYSFGGIQRYTKEIYEQIWFLLGMLAGLVIVMVIWIVQDASTLQQQNDWQCVEQKTEQKQVCTKERRDCKEERINPYVLWLDCRDEKCDKQFFGIGNIVEWKQYMDECMKLDFKS